MKKQRTNQRGITLIALVITIIVLLILAGVSLSLVVGENGILNKAQTAVGETKKASVLEEAEIVLSGWQTDYLINNTPYEGRSETTASGVVVVYTAGNVIATDNKSGKVYTAPFSETTGLGEWDNGAVLDENSQVYKAMNPKIPTGFTHTEGEWNTGYVIKDSSGDEFVWIPVLSEASYVKKNSSRNFCIENQDADEIGKDVLGFIRGDVTGLDTILGTTVKQTLPNGQIENEAAPEAAVVNAVGGFYVSRYEIGIDNAERTTGTQADVRTDSTTYYSQKGKEPVRKISQIDSLAVANAWKTGADYQSGLITGTEWDVMCNFIGWSICDNDCTNWGNYININSKVYAENEVWHALFQKDKGHELWSNSAIQKGNKNVEADVNKTDRMIFATGTFENINGGNTMKKNIYDVAGNVWEWTTEVPLNGADAHRILRGGSTNHDGSSALATYRGGDRVASISSYNFGFRVVLYVK